MKISVLTIILILFIFCSLVTYYLNKQLYNSQSKLCEVLQPDFSKDYTKINTELNEQWGECLDLLLSYSNKVSISMYSSYILIFLVILSYKVDHLKR